ncbi:zinc finger FYVE domain-containing protein 1 [Petromyzon marinus]|uniref:zinc finger FYVE domain-containing protein 1 n=1 Tax=Petromyzon marinus TaxID=7757 RepID=UPI003F729C0C
MSSGVNKNANGSSASPTKPATSTTISTSAIAPSISGSITSTGRGSSGHHHQQQQQQQLKQILQPSGTSTSSPSPGAAGGRPSRTQQQHHQGGIPVTAAATTPQTSPWGPPCHERYACGGAALAEIECDECGSLQCGDCSTLLHNQPKVANHDRRRLVPPLQPGHPAEATPSAAVAAAAAGGGTAGAVATAGPGGWQGPAPCEAESCRPRQRATIRCEPCGVNVCRACADKAHNGRKKHSLVVLAGRGWLDGPMEQEGDMARKSRMNAVDAKSFLLVDETERLQISSEQELIEKLSCHAEDLLKVVSIIGNTGDGKSHTLNHTFFHKAEVFHTSATQESCTVGVWAAYDRNNKLLTIDTEGLLGVTANSSQRTRLLLKVMAVSDVVLYRTRAERLHSDLFKFLGNASEAYLKHFTGELRATSARCGMEGPLSVLGPAIIIFHETQHTNLLGQGEGQTPEVLLQRNFKELKCTPEAFSTVEYVGTRTFNPPTDFGGLLRVIQYRLKSNSNRASRTPGVIFKALEALSERFSGEIPVGDMARSSFFPDEYFTCSASCLSCGLRCRNSMNHHKDGVQHLAEGRCKYNYQCDNRVFTCKHCYENGKEVIVVPKTSASNESPWFGLAKYAWSGYVLECPNCGVIYRSRQYWYGNQDPEDTVVRTELKHVWPGANGFIRENHNAAQRLLDGVNLVAQSVSDISSGPARAVSDWLTDQIAPAYWRPNAVVIACHNCNKQFEEKDTKHHCRACGEGFCGACSSRSRPVPERGWGPNPVRVCDACFQLARPQEQKQQAEGGEEDESGKVMVRKVGEVVQNTLGAVATTFNYPLGLVKDVARPTYWVPDHEIASCQDCNKDMTSGKLAKHHCRACGKGFCNECSTARRPVPSRGWDHPVRVCNTCSKCKGEL